jgi:SAM-dependent methyltransferase
MSWDSTWESIFSTRPWGKYPSEDLVRFIARNFYNVKKRSEIKILEVGSGTGANLWFIAREGFQVFGIEGSRSAIKLCNDRLDLEVPGWVGTIDEGDISNINFPDSYFDAVIDIEACYANDFENSIKIYSEMVRVLKLGGKFYSRCLAKGSKGDETGKCISYNSYITNSGPAFGTGLARYTSKDDLNILIPKSLTILEIDIIERGALINNHIKEWCITGEKNNIKF